MGKSKLSSVLRLATRYWFVFLFVAALNVAVYLSGVSLFNLGLAQWGLFGFLVIVFIVTMIKIDGERVLIESGRKPSPGDVKLRRAVIWSCSFILAAMSAFSFFGMSVLNDICDSNSNRNECRAYEAILESPNGPVKEVLFRGWAWKPCAKCFASGEINAPELAFTNVAVSRNRHETVYADVSAKGRFEEDIADLARIVKAEPLHAQTVINSMVSEKVFVCLGSIDKWDYPDRVSSVVFTCDRGDVHFWSGEVEVKNVKISKTD